MIAGAERYKAITINHIRNADGAYIVYDINNYDSFDKIDFWLDILKSANDEKVVIYLIGNKIDLVKCYSKNRKVTKEQAIIYAKSRHFNGFAECSALENINIKETFNSFYTTLHRKNKDKLIEKTQRKLNQLRLMQEKQLNKNSDCC